MGNAFLQREFASSASTTDMEHLSLTKGSRFNAVVLGPAHLPSHWPNAQCPDWRHCRYQPSRQPASVLLPTTHHSQLRPQLALLCWGRGLERYGEDVIGRYGEDIIGNLSTCYISSSLTSMFWPWIQLLYSTRVSEHLVYHNALSRSEI